MALYCSKIKSLKSKSALVFLGWLINDISGCYVCEIASMNHYGTTIIVFLAKKTNIYRDGALLLFHY